MEYPDPVVVPSGWQPATSTYADGRSSDDVTALSREMEQHDAIASGAVDPEPEGAVKLAPNIYSTIPKAFDGAAKLAPWTSGEIFPVFGAQFSMQEMHDVRSKVRRGGNV